MSYKYSFADNEVYSADDVNKITRRLVSSGIEDSFTDGVAYNVSKFNEAGKLLYTSGVVPENCLTMKVTHTGEGAVLINPGIAFFEDGSVIEIDDGGEELAYTKGAVNYVYLKNDLESANISYPCCATDEPEGDYVMLAVIDENDNITDKRTYARGKLPGYQSVAGEALFLDENVEITISSEHTAMGEATFDVGQNNFRYIFVVGKIGEIEQRESMSVYSIEDGQIVSLVRTGETDALFASGKLYLYHDRTNKRIEAVPVFSEGKLKLDISMYDGRNKIGVAGENISINVQLIFI